MGFRHPEDPINNQPEYQVDDALLISVREILDALRELRRSDSQMMAKAADTGVRGGRRWNLGRTVASD